jgi:bacterioferritin (cytochrome b1)
VSDIQYPWRAVLQDAAVEIDRLQKIVDAYDDSFSVTPQKETRIMGLGFSSAYALGVSTNSPIRRGAWAADTVLRCKNPPFMQRNAEKTVESFPLLLTQEDINADDWCVACGSPETATPTHPEDLKEELMRSPEVQARQPISFQEFAVLMCADLTNEYTHMAFYLYHSSFVRGIHAEEYAGFFKKAAEGEMQHISEFLQYIHGFENLGLLARNINNEGAPDLYVPAYGLDFKRFTHPVAAMQEAIRLEETVIDNYITRIKQAERLYEPHATAIKLFYEKQLEDSYGDVKQMRRLASQEHRAEIT